jgi:CHAD domain-containing protein
MTVEAFAQTKLDLLRRRLDYQVRRARKLSDARSVHDLRVAIRRYGQGLKLFRELLPDQETKKSRRRLRKILKAAGAVRNLDIALDLMREARCRDEGLRRRLMNQRREARKALKCLA